ncbi:MAG: hypothetical protein V1874_03410 [Spirochaetota bacterium]
MIKSIKPGNSRKATTVNSKTKVKKKSDKVSNASTKQKKKINLLKLCSVMNNYSDDANDKEIIKRFKTTITSSINEDISKTSLATILKKPEDVNIGDFSESIQPYIKHYLFMFNRSTNNKLKKK